jgi:hypothetical protein
VEEVDSKITLFGFQPGYAVVRGNGDHTFFKEGIVISAKKKSVLRIKSVVVVNCPRNDVGCYQDGLELRVTQGTFATVSI